jgi:hypothetical protein
MTRLASKLTLSKFVLHCFLFTNFFLLVSWILQYFGIWHVVVAFILGILTTLGAITCAIYYLLGRIDKKLQQRHQSILQANLDFKNHPNWAFALEKTVAEDESKPIAIEGTLEVQFGGKRKTKMPYLCCLKGTTLYLQKKKMSKIIGIPLEGAEIRKVDEKVFKTKNCLEMYIMSIISFGHLSLTLSQRDNQRKRPLRLSFEFSRYFLLSVPRIVQNASAATDNVQSRLHLPKLRLHERYRTLVLFSS